MKKIILFISALFVCTVAIAHTVNWYVDNQIIETTTCVSGESVTPPTAPYKYGYHFKKWFSHQPIEYLESTGTQWINTGLKTDDGDITVTAVFMPTLFPSSESYACIFGCEYNFQAGYTANGTPYIGNASATQNFFNLYTKAVVNAVLSKNIPGTYYVDNVSTGLSRSFRSGIELSLYTNRSGAVSIGRLFSFTASRNNKIIMDLIPVLDKNGTPCMYDKVSRQFFYNQGTGQFIAGPIVSE